MGIKKHPAKPFQTHWEERGGKPIVTIDAHQCIIPHWHDMAASLRQNSTHILQKRDQLPRDVASVADGVFHFVAQLGEGLVVSIWLSVSSNLQVR